MTAKPFVPEDFGIGRLFFHIRDAVVVANARSEQIVLWNECAQGLLGYSHAEALDMPLHALVPEELRPRHRAGIQRYQETGQGMLIEGGHPVELAALHKEGHTVAIELTLTQIPERTVGGDRFVLAIIRDITERKQAEAAALKLKETADDRRRALELNDTIVQGLAVAKLALENGEDGVAFDTISSTLERAQALVARLLGQIEETEGPFSPGDLVVRGDET